ncbi:MAG: hypothetical protein JW984_04145 [Deltaproteobacteria bacterium]|uniref:DUF3859 domain-containing protein n=1 Tax=Candidatus Zymogenus saltonus TaxID=2844893 RepID=A0A9D8KDR9_9DELT|nr:hypothetical protein [Candidatus Zymogenus saltonus]
METREHIAGITITNFEFGLLAKDQYGMYYVSKKTKSIPNIPGIHFGFIFSYENDMGKTVGHRWEMILPREPKTAQTIDGSTDIEYLPGENRVVSATFGLDTESSIQYSVNRIDPGDPSGRWVVEIYIGDQLYRTVVFDVR